MSEGGNEVVGVGLGLLTGEQLCSGAGETLPIMLGVISSRPGRVNITAAKTSIPIPVHRSMLMPAARVLI
jgi:hypothetical protein